MVSEGGPKPRSVPRYSGGIAGNISWAGVLTASAVGNSGGDQRFSAERTGYKDNMRSHNWYRSKYSYTPGPSLTYVYT